MVLSELDLAPSSLSPIFSKHRALTLGDLLGDASRPWVLMDPPPAQVMHVRTMEHDLPDRPVDRNLTGWLN